MELPPIRSPGSGRKGWRRLFKYIGESLRVAWQIGRLTRRAKRLEHRGLLQAAYDETIFALEVLRSPWLDYWNPVAFGYRFEATVALDRLASKLGRPVPRAQIEEQLEAIGMFREFGQHDTVFEEEVSALRRRLQAREEPHQG
jgi:hypothetical protein